jgi:hypothetical protein
MPIKMKKKEKAFLRRWFLSKNLKNEKRLAKVVGREFKME